MIDVLIVEDDPMVAEVTTNYLKDVAGFQLVAHARNVEEARKALTHYPHIRLILLDVYMPGENGLTLLTELRQQRVAADVIVLTAASDKESIQTALRHGAVDYLIKPYQFERFQEALMHFKKKQTIWTKEEPVSQQELDELWFRKDNEKNAKIDLPKGLTKETLGQVWQAIERVGQNSFSTEDVALHACISRVSVKKYLTFLLEWEVLELQPTYGSIGRPIHLYKLKYEHKQRIKAFL
ncbi:response regulator [Shouchella lehensis]|uniref:Response regulator n=1 Tax=Shouchella lehensis TaxID=300825 RepID=A0A4Y7WG06_9BACI|nr:response regulator [Shouchella lehensis]MBG9785261.1 hypothetical protein [Shouchella lehensis]TES46706.1 response regulator [Shouchella lehensis]